MVNALLFVTTVLIWGTTWIAMAAQVGDVPVMVSIFLRFALAGSLMLLVMTVFGRIALPLRWRFVVLQALCLFCFNFIGLYNASQYITSGLVAVVFSFAAILNAINARLIFGERVRAQTITAGLIGVSGLVLIFWNDLFARFDAQTLTGIAWAAFGTLMFSLGNMASRHNSNLGITPLTANTWGMCIGALVLLVLILGSAQPIKISTDPIYLGALIYLAVVGSVIAFTAYLVLVNRIGSARAGYATVAFPVVALALSTLLEGYVWTMTAAVGVMLTILGNIVMFLPVRQRSNAPVGAEHGKSVRPN